MSDFLEEVQSKLTEVISFENKKMFGAFSFVKDTATFGFVKDGKFYFRTDETSNEKYLAAKSEQFNPMGKGKGMPYHTVPSNVYKNKKLLKIWADEAFGVALKHKKKKK